MAKKIKRFLAFAVFSLFFAMFSKKFQTSDSSGKTNTLASAKGVKSQKSLGQTLSSFVGVNSAEALVYCNEVTGTWE